MGTVILKNCSAGGMNKTPEVFKDVINNTSSFSITASDLKGVKSLSNAFVHSNLSSFEMPKSITNSLDSTTLTSCKNLTAYTVESGSTKYRVVDGCLFGYDSYGNPSTSLYRGTASGVVPPSDVSGRIVSIGAGAFNDFTNLTSVIFEDDVIVDTNAYSGCSNIKYVYGDSQDIANVLENSGSTSFDVTITGKTTGIIRNLFYNNSYVKSLTVATDSPIYVESNAFRYTNLDKVIIPAISGLESNAFANCSNLKEVSISHYEPLQNYGTYLSSAFGSCPIEKLTCPTALLSYIPLTAVKEVELTEGTFINTNTFSNNSNIQKITIPNTIKNMYNYCFYECPNLTSVNFNGTIEEWCGIKFSHNSSGYASTNPLCPGPSGSVSSPKGNLYLYGKRVTEIVFSPNATINSYSLYNAKIKSVRFLGTASVGLSALQYSSLSDVYFASTLPGGLSSNVFNGCSNLRNIHYASTLSDLVPQTVSDDGFFMTLTATTAMKTLYINENQRVTDLVIPEGLTNPGRFPYLDIVSVSIPSTVTSLGNAVFRNCSNLETVTFANNSAVTSISTSDYSPFYYCSSIKSMTLPFVGGSKSPSSASSSTVFGAIFGTLSFTGATAVTQNYGQSSSRTCYIPSGLTHVTVLGGKMMYGAFSGCTMITNLNIGEDVKMSRNAFTGVNGLANLVISPDNRSNLYGTFTGAVITNAEMPAELYYLADREATITNLTMNGGRYIYPRMFENNTSLTSITLPNTIKKIGHQAFKGCTNLPEVDMPSGLTMIFGMLDDGYADTTVFNFDSDTWFRLCLNNGCPSRFSTLKLDGQPATSIIVPDGITTLMPYSAYNTNITHLTFPQSLTTIGSYSIKLDGRVYDETTLTIPGTVKKIDDNGIYVESQFSSDYVLRNLVLSEGIEELGKNCIYFYGGNHTIDIPSTVRKISTEFVDGYYTHFTLNANNSYYTMVSGCLIENATHKLIKADYLSTGSVIPQDAGVVEICESAFSRREFYDANYNTTTLTIPNTVVTIGKGAFSQATGFDTVNIPASVAYLGVGAFEEFNSSHELTTVNFDNNSHLTRIRANTFNRCSNLTSVSLPDSVEIIGSDAFNGCTSLTSITLPSSLFKLWHTAFCDCTSLTSITLPPSLTQVGSRAFSGCTSLSYNTYDNANYLGTSTNPYYALIKATSTSITSCVVHPDCVVIADAAFAHCYSLNEITIPSSVRYIGVENDALAEGNDEYAIGAFVGCSIARVNIDDLDSWASIVRYNTGDSPFTSSTTLYINGVAVTDLTFSNSITKINDYAFYGLTHISSVTLPNSITEIGDYALTCCGPDTDLILSDNLSTVQYYSFGGSTDSHNASTDDNGGKYIPSNSYQYYMMVVSSQDAPINPQCRIIYGVNLGYSASYDLVIPSNVKCIVGTKLTLSGPNTLTVDQNNTIYHSNGNCVIKTATHELILGSANCVIPNDGSVTSIRKYALSQSRDSLVIPSSITALESESISGSYNYLEIPDTVTTLFGESVDNWELQANVKVAKLGTAFKKITIYMLNSLQSSCPLTTLYLSRTFEKMNYHCFNTDINLTDIYYDGTKYEWSKVRIPIQTFAQEDFAHDYNFNAYTKYFTIHCTDGDI